MCTKIWSLSKRNNVTIHTIRNISVFPFKTNKTKIKPKTKQMNWWLKFYKWGSNWNKEMLILNLLRVYPEKEIQGELELCSARLQNKGNLQRQKHQGHSHKSCLSRMIIGAGKKLGCLLSKDWLGSEMFAELQGRDLGVIKLQLTDVPKHLVMYLDLTNFRENSSSHRCRNKKRLDTQWLSFFVFLTMIISL